MTLASLDTNVVLRLIVPEPAEQHARARALLVSPQARFVVSD